jgi:undecaprenyl-diphosphatase
VSLPGLDYLVTATNWLGQGTLRVMAVSVLVVSLLFLAKFRAAALLVLVASLFRVVNPFVERILKSPRPTDELVRVTEHATGFGFPSDHALGATLLFGSLVIAIPAIVRRRWLAISLQVLASLMIVATGFGRVYTGAHWPTDVVGGILIGLVILHPLSWLYNRFYWQIQNQWIFVGGRR